MDAPSEKVFMQKMLKCVEPQVEVLRKILGHLSKIEKEKAKKHKTEHKSSGLTQEGIDRVMAKGKVHLPLPNFKPQLRGASGPWTFKRAYVNDFSKLGDTRSWEDHYWPKWTSKVGITQVIPTRFMLERNVDPSSDNEQYLMMNKKEEGDDEMISCWSGDDGDWFLDEVRRDFPNESNDLYDMTEATHV
nr:hypothetical protein CFP56_41217 [Quercus suber]